MAYPTNGKAIPLARRVPHAARMAVARLRRRPPTPSLRSWTGSMTAIAVLALAASLLAMITIDPLAVEYVRDHWRGTLLRGLAAITDLGKSEWYLVPAGLAAIAVALADWNSRDPRAKAHLSYMLGQSAFAFGAVALSGILVNVAKLLVGRGRPVMFDELGPLAIRPFQLDYAFLSYPSGHSTTAGAVALVALVWFPRWSFVILPVAGIIAFSRVAALAHYPGDVVAGFAFGLLFSLWLARWLACRGVVFRIVPGKLLPVPRHGRSWGSLRRSR